ncbi:unnamed protein product [Danaus chrysippus]|uniref:(African queen) hypothetical protein n=1 Tax=Danaus chrysippus TaxID=151541 RepID=A0A8J2M943_9NEOP|nr:unnamed protein product [Danaus chrysippus]
MHRSTRQPPRRARCTGGTEELAGAIELPVWPGSREYTRKAARRRSQCDLARRIASTIIRRGENVFKRMRTRRRPRDHEEIAIMLVGPHDNDPFGRPGFQYGTEQAETRYGPPVCRDPRAVRCCIWGCTVPVSPQGKGSPLRQ